jgi:hypothetical protein
MAGDRDPEPKLLMPHLGVGGELATDDGALDASGE